MDVGIVFEIKEARYGCSQGRFKLYIDADTPIFGDACVALRGSTVGCEIKENHKVPLKEHVVGDLDTRIAVVDARAAKQRLVSHGRRLFVARSYGEAARRYLLSVDVHGKVVYFEMLKVVGIGVDRAREIRIFNHAKQ